MTTAMLGPVFAMAAFALGSIPFALLLGKLRGIDIRTMGSKNVGATNLGRALGFKWFLMAFGLDALKGFAPVLAYGLTAGIVGKEALALETVEAIKWLAIVIAAVMGHMFSPWVGFKGGKGVATGLGALLGVFPVLTAPGVGALIVFLVILAMWKYVSAASVAAAGSLPFWTWFFFSLASRVLGTPGDKTDPFSEAEPYPVKSGAFVGVAVLLAVFVILKHRGNLSRLAAGTEPKIGGKRG